MPAEITDALIDRSVRTPRMAAAGRDYWARGRVRRIAVAPGGRSVQASVAGGEPAPYLVELHFGATPAEAVSGFCTCPVGAACKHVAAVLYALQANGSAAGAPDPLPPALAQWATAMRPLLGPEDPATAARAVIYVVRAQALDGAVRSGKKRPASAMAEPGSPLRLFVEAFDHALGPDGEPVGQGRKVSGYSLAYQTAEAGPALGAEDQPLVRRLQLRLGDTDADNCLKGAGGFDLFERVVATGRARWGTARGVRLRFAEPEERPLAWVHDAAGRTRLALAVDGPDALVGLVAPPVLIDTGEGRVTRVDANLAALVAEQLLRLPPVPPDAVEALAARWPDIAPPGVSPPRAPRIRELGRLRPTPVLTLSVQRVKMEERPAHRWSYRRTVQVDCALARLRFDYGVATVDCTTGEDRPLVRDGDGLVRFARDHAAEADAAVRLLETGLAPLAGFDEALPGEQQHWDHVPDFPAEAGDLVPFLMRDADALRREGWRVELAPDLPLRLVAPDPGGFAVELTPSGTDWFDLALGATIDGERVDLVPALRRLLDATDPAALETALAAAEPEARFPVALGDGRVAEIEAGRLLPMLRALLLLATAVNEGNARSRPGVAARDLGTLAALDAAGPPCRGADALRELARALTSLRFTPTPLPPGFRAALRPYQQTGLDWLDALGRAGLGGLLADDMGLGKTVQTLAHLSVLKAEGRLDGPALIVAPTSVLPAWAAEAARFAPGLSVLVLHGPDRHRLHDDMGAHDLIVTSYPLLVRDRERLAKQRFGLVVLDEAHNLKNPRTAGHAAARALDRARTLALTGTPVENRLTDAWALFELVAPGLLGSARDFNRRYRLPIEKDDGDARARLRRTLRPFLLRRTKDAVATDLPPKSVLPLAIPLGAAQSALHESQRLLMQQRIRDEIARVGLLRAQVFVLAALTRLRQICCDPRLVDAGSAAGSAKLDRLFDLLDELVPEGRRILLFSQFTSMLDLIKPELDRRGVAWTELTGDTKDRRAPVARFQAGEVPVILVSLKAGGTGLTLTAADTVLLYDPWWNPAVEAQAIDRAHRIGQTRPVFVYRMIATDTIEEKMVALQERKAGIAATLWGDDAATPAGLSEEDIAFLLGG